MVSLVVVFWMYVVLFAIIGAMRGWAKEALVTFSVILALALISLLEKYVPFVSSMVALTVSPPPTMDAASLKSGLTTLFWLRALIMVVLVFFGYQTPNIAKFAPKMTREKLQDTLLGTFLGMVNGFLIVGSIWFYLHSSDYPFKFIAAPDTAPVILNYLAPRLLGVPAIYFAVVVAFIFVLVVFL